MVLVVSNRVSIHGDSNESCVVIAADRAVPFQVRDIVSIQIKDLPNLIEQLQRLEKLLVLK